MTSVFTLDAYLSREVPMAEIRSEFETICESKSTIQVFKLRLASQRKVTIQLLYDGEYTRDQAESLIPLIEAKLPTESSVGSIELQSVKPLFE